MYKKSAARSLELIVDGGDGVLMISAEMPSETATAGGAVYDVFAGAVIVIGVAVSYLGAVIAKVDKVKIRGGDVKGRVSEISCDGQRLQKDLCADDRRAEIQENASVKLTDRRAHLLEIYSRAFTYHLHIARGVLMNDIGSEGDVVGGGNVIDIRLIKHAILAVGEFVGIFKNVFSQGLSVAETLRRAQAKGFVHPGARLLPHSEGAVLDGGGHVLAGTSEIGKLEIVNASRTVGGDMG